MEPFQLPLTPNFLCNQPLLAGFCNKSKWKCHLSFLFGVYCTAVTSSDSEEQSRLKRHFKTSRLIVDWRSRFWRKINVGGFCWWFNWVLWVFLKTMIVSDSSQKHCVIRRLWKGFFDLMHYWVSYLYTKMSLSTKCRWIKAIENDFCFLKEIFKSPFSGSIVYFNRPYKYHDPNISGLIVGFNYSVRQIT